MKIESEMKMGIKIKIKMIEIKEASLLLCSPALNHNLNSNWSGRTAGSLAPPVATHAEQTIQ
jgi:hypothetical protein